MFEGDVASSSMAGRIVRVGKEDRETEVIFAMPGCTMSERFKGVADERARIRARTTIDVWRRDMDAP